MGNGFVFDDSAYLASPLVRNLAVLDILGTNWLGLDIYRPLTLLSLALDFRLFAEEPFGYHLTNLLLHLANGTLFYVLARRLLNHASAALWAACLYVAHPIQTEVVAWISARGDLLATSLLLSAFVAHRRDSRRWRLLAWTLYAGALLAKETAVILPVVLFLRDFYLDRCEDRSASFLPRSTGSTRRLTESPGILLMRWFRPRTRAFSSTTASHPAGLPGPL